MSAIQEQEICAYQTIILDMQARDALTSLYNREHFLCLLDTEFKKDDLAR